jgi:hypothetical protein
MIRAIEPVTLFKSNSDNSEIPTWGRAERVAIDLFITRMMAFLSL